MNRYEKDGFKWLIEAVKSGDPYIHTAKLVKAVPDTATKKTNPKSGKNMQKAN